MLLQQLRARLEGAGPSRFRSIDDLVARSGINREELSVLAEIGALNSFGYTRREALWQVERAIRPAGELFEEGQRAAAADSGSTEAGQRGHYVASASA